MIRKEQELQDETHDTSKPGQEEYEVNQCTAACVDGKISPCPLSQFREGTVFPRHLSLGSPAQQLVLARRIRGTCCSFHFGSLRTCLRTKTSGWGRDGLGKIEEGAHPATEVLSSLFVSLLARIIIRNTGIDLAAKGGLGLLATV